MTRPVPIKRIAIFFILTAAAMSPIVALSNFNKDVFGYSRADSTVTVTYIGNEGFMVKSATKKILIDALHLSESAHYESPSPVLLEKIEAGRPPFDNIDLILASHHHHDHFSALWTARYLLHNSHSFLICTEQTRNLFEKHGDSFSFIQDRIAAILPSSLESREIRCRSMPVRIYRLDHSPYYETTQEGKKHNRHEKVQNLGFLITMDGMKIFHCGDSVTAESEEWETFRFDKENIDIAFVPLGFIANPESRNVLYSRIKARYYILMHIAPEQNERIRSFLPALNQEHPGFYVFSQILESKKFQQSRN